MGLVGRGGGLERGRLCCGTVRGWDWWGEREGREGEAVLQNLREEEPHTVRGLGEKNLPSSCPDWRGIAFMLWGVTVLSLLRYHCLQ